jgi:Ca2+-binding EF-hand superfamily protein
VDSRLDAIQLRRLMDELGQPLSDAEAKVAMTFLDEDGNGVVDFNEFVAWWAGTVRIAACVCVCVCVRVRVVWR